ncbi:hypothetical protein [Nonomuraea longicatena]|uniref:Uncharacterized protein n=1 Tax=Nonomuraea longicatena TaxID=83682 RepID=A0ABN1Q1Z1_9ACTN
MDLKACEVCGSTAEQEILSCHSTSLGRVIYVRCSCGSMGVRLTPFAQPSWTIVEVSGPAA